VSVVVPVYNSESTLLELVTRLSMVLTGICSTYEVILVNDGSSDRSWETIQKLAPGRPWLVGIHLMRNYGQHNALLCGVRAAKNEIIITMDDDLQHPPEVIPKLLESLTEGFDVVYGVPQKLPHSWWRNWFSVLTKRLLAYVMGVKNMRDVSAFRAFRSFLRKAFETYQNPNVILDVLLSWGTTRFTTVAVNEAPRSSGHSNYSFSRLVQVALVVLTGFNTAPLRFTNMVGFLFTLLGIGIFIYVLWIYFSVGSVPGFPFLASIIALFSGAQMFALGIIGEYLGRVFDRSVDRPAYVIGEILEDPKESKV
jgi:glycosyltransferase involved in cell wall biosynthesis